MRTLLVRLLGAALIVAVGGLLLTSLAPSSSIAAWAPCPRNWGWADAWLPRTSPLEAVPIRFSHGHAKLCYGRPSLAGRTMLGGEAVPYGRLWRLGANEPTSLHLDVAAELADLYLRPGGYSLYAVPGERSWELVVNRATRQWGLESLYEGVAHREVGRFRVPVEPLAAPVETLTVRALGDRGDAFTLIFEWQTARVRVPLVAAVAAPIGREELDAEPAPAGAPELGD